MNSKKFYISLLVLTISFIIGLLFYSKLPDVLPSHWNAYLNDGYSYPRFS